MRARLPRLVLAVVVVLGTFTLPAVAAPGYRQVVDLTFPTVPGYYRDDFAAGRSGGRVHRATDIYNNVGTPVYAARSGRIVWIPDYEHATAGYAIQIRGDDGRLYAYYHLGPSGGSPGRAYVRGLAVGSYVRRGQHIAALGDSGNARGGAPHLHFEIHDSRVQDPYGSQRINPYRSLRAAQRRGDYGAAVSAPSRSRRPGSGVLRRGDRGKAVSAWQRSLRKVGYRVAVDGIYGPGTVRATRRFQRSRRLTVDGVVGPATRGVMRRVLRNQERRNQRRAAQRRTAQRDGTLRRGDRGRPVAAWQRALNRAGIPTGVDGVFGPATERATRRFQRSKDLVVDGVVGPTTRRAMQNSNPARSRAPSPERPAPALRRGDRGRAVATWQRALRRAGYGIAVDGVFGPATERATRRFQRSESLVIDGVVGPATRRAMWAR